MPAHACKECQNAQNARGHFVRVRLTFSSSPYCSLLATVQANEGCHRDVPSSGTAPWLNRLRSEQQIHPTSSSKRQA
eukprot:1160388-Pelagomonas_calceolata.AAC.1